MEEEDALCGLVPASLPVHAVEEAELSLPSLQVDTAVNATKAGDEDGWSFEKALQSRNMTTDNDEGKTTNNSNNPHGGGGSSTNSDDEKNSDDAAEDEKAKDEGSDSDDADEQDDGAVVFRDNGNTGAASSGADASHGADMDDDALLAINNKKEAKRLGKKLYKRWKKLTKKAKKSKSKSSKKDSSRRSKKDKKTKQSSKEKESKKRSSRKRKTRDDDDDNLPLDMTDDMSDVDVDMLRGTGLSQGAANMEARLHKAALREAKMRSEKATKKAATQKTTSTEAINNAKELVAEMAKARRLDDDIVYSRSTKPGQFPLNRVALKERVQGRCRQAFMVGPLIEAGVLQELSYWLYDVDRAQPAPYELRTAALDVLLTFPLEGSIAATEDLTQFMGIGRDHLIKTDLGRALNALRKCADETIDNRGKCVQLLASFSRVISGGAEQDPSQETKSKAVWKCQRDPTVASPFAVLETRSEALQKNFMKPDPRDPTSYNGLLPWRPPAATVTNVSGKLDKYIE